MASNENQSSERSGLERALSVVTEVRPGEGITAVLLTVTVFFLLVAYYVIKPVREGLILAMEGGAEKKSYASAAIAITLLLAVPAYSKVANKISKHKLVVGVSLFSLRRICSCSGCSRTHPCAVNSVSCSSRGSASST